MIYGGQRTRHTDLASLSTFTVTALAPARGGDAPSRALQSQPLVLASHDSGPLLEDVQVINKVSQNLHAEILLRLLGREKGTAGTVEGGLEVVRGFLNRAGIPSDQYAFYDGSGLSRQNLVTPDAVVQLLRYCAAQPWGEASARRCRSEAWMVRWPDASAMCGFREACRRKRARWAA